MNNDVNEIKYLMALNKLGIDPKYFNRYNN